MGNNSSWCTVHKSAWKLYPDNATFCTEKIGQCGKIVNQSMYCLTDTDCCPAGVSGLRHLLILTLMWIPIVTLFGNTLVILSVWKFKNLQTPTNHYIVSLAVADISLAVLVMPVQIFVETHNGRWTMSPYFCDAFVMFDVWFCTASIFNLVAISFDRHKAVTKPLDYASQRSLTWIYVKIGFSWGASFAIAIPLGIGYNWTPDRSSQPFACRFFNSDFLFYSSVGSFYMPTVLMIILYARVFNTLRVRAKSKLKTKQKDQNALNGSNGALYLNCDAHLPNDESPVNSSTTPQTIAVEYNTATEATYTVVSPRQFQKEEMNAAPSDSHVTTRSTDDITYVAANLNAPGVQAGLEVHADPQTASGTIILANGQSVIPNPQNEKTDVTEEMQFSDWQEFRKHLKRRVRIAKHGGSLHEAKVKEDKECLPLCVNLRGLDLPKVRRKKKKAKKEKSAIRREQKATQTLAIVLGVFLVSWTPFFTVNIIDAICLKFPKWRGTGISICHITEILYSWCVWLGYVNSCLNPVIYTIFNADFRKAFKMLLKRK